MVAQFIEDRLDCDSYEIRAADPYSSAYDPTVRRNVAEQEADARPAIAGDLPDVSGYEAIILGSPIWNVRAPMIMSTFIEGVDLTGKTLHPFVTYAVSGLSGVDDDYRAALPNTTVTDGLAIRGEEAADSQNRVDAWLRERGFLG